MLKTRLTQCASALALAGILAGGAATLAETSRRSAPAPRSRIQAEPDIDVRPDEDRPVRALVEDLENSTPEEVRSGRIDRYFTDPAVIITGGQMHQIDWARMRKDRDVGHVSPEDRDNRENRDDQNNRVDPDDRDKQNDRPDRENRDDRDAASVRPSSTVRVEGFQTRSIDSRTLVVMYTAVIPQTSGTFRQPVVATLVRPNSDRGWLIASYTAENAAIPGAAEADAGDEPPTH